MTKHKKIKTTLNERKTVYDMKQKILNLLKPSIVYKEYFK